MAVRLVAEGVRKRRASRDRTFTLEIEHLVLEPGRMVVVGGRSGSGKSTLLDLIGLALAPETARRFELTIGGDSIDLMALWQGGQREHLAALRRRHFGYVVQSGALLPFLSAAQNIALPRRLNGAHSPDHTHDVAATLEIAALMREFPDKLSMGQRQRVAIARALAHDPPFVLADEPTAALDPQNAAIVMRLMTDLVARRQRALLIVSHDLDLVAEMGLAICHIEEEADGEGFTSRFDDMARQGERTTCVSMQPA